MSRFIHWVLTALVAIGLVQIVGVASAADRLRVPDDMDLPFYVVGLGHTDDGWVGTVFYRSLDDAPDDITVNQFVAVDPDDYPLNVEGFLVWVLGEYAPMVMKLANQPGQVVEIAFTSAEDYLPAMEGGTTVKEIKEMPSLIVGYADCFLEVQQPADRSVPGKGFHHGTIASGVLEDGRPFQVYSVYTGGTFHMNLKVRD